MSEARRLFLIRGLLIGFVVGLVISGVTAFPLAQEVRYIASLLDHGSVFGQWILKVRDALDATEQRYPFLFYGYDWLAFGHVVIAIAFLGPIKDPVRNIWVIHWGMIACVLVIPLALICGAVRGIPFWWQMIDCSFGVVGIVPLWICSRLARSLEATVE